MQHRLTRSNNNSILSVHRGDTILIELDETPTTGYVWELTTVDNNITQLQTSRYEALSTAIGGGGNRVLSLLVTGSGTGAIHLENRRPWSGDVAETFSVQVQSN